jgi:hypothetical protein
MTTPQAEYDADRSQGFAGAWTALVDDGIPVVALHEVPRLTTPAIECMSQFGATIDGCSEPVDGLLTGHPSWMALAAQLEPRVPVIDLTPGLCPDGTCRPVIGNIYTYRDDSHVSAPYAQSLSWMLAAGLQAAEPGLFAP